MFKVLVRSDLVTCKVILVVKVAPSLILDWLFKVTSLVRSDLATCKVTAKQWVWSNSFT